MLNLFKFLFIIDVFKSNKKAFFYIVILIVLLLILPFVFEDIFQFINHEDKAFWILTKWLLLILLLICIVFKVYNIFKKSALRINGLLEKNESDHIYKSLINMKLQSKGEKIKIKNKHRVKG